MPATLVVCCCTQARLLLEIHLWKTLAKLSGVALFRPEVPADCSWLDTSVVILSHDPITLLKTETPKHTFGHLGALPDPEGIWTWFCLFSTSNWQSIWKNKTHISVWKRQIERITDHVDAPNVRSCSYRGSLSVSNHIGEVGITSNLHKQT